MNHVLETLFFALIPILITIGLGYYSAVKGTFDEQDSHKLARLVLNYMLPLNCRHLGNVSKNYDPRRGAGTVASGGDGRLLSFDDFRLPLRLEK